MDKQVKLRIATVQDAAVLLDIYAPYVENTAITFEYTVPSVREFEHRISNTLQTYPYLVAEIDNEIVGYTYASPFRERCAYQWAVEVSIYVKKTAKKMGIGKKLYQTLETILSLQNITNLYACIADTNEEDLHLTKDSILFHQRLGYRQVGKCTQCGYKFHRWYDIVWMEKHIQPHTIPSENIKTFEEIREMVKTQYHL